MTQNQFQDASRQTGFRVLYGKTPEMAQYRTVTSVSHSGTKLAMLAMAREIRESGDASAGLCRFRTAA